MRMIERDDSVLVVVDAQPGFAGERGATTSGSNGAVVARIAWLAGVAAALGVPAVVTEEDPAHNGTTDSRIVAALPAGTPAAFVKPVFGLAGVPAILAAIGHTGRRTIVLTGFETDVCVAQSALGLLDLGYRVAVVVDATGSPGEMHEHGLRRMRDAGAVAIHAKGVYYEWVRSLEAARAFQAGHPELVDPPGFSL
jgi:nicotinamidase-related amidase